MDHPTPSQGRIVLYFPHGTGGAGTQEGEPEPAVTCAAIVSRVREHEGLELVDIHVFPPDSTSYPINGVEHRDDAETPAHACWDWPPRA